MSSKLNFSNKFQAISAMRCKNTNFPINKQKASNSASTKQDLPRSTTNKQKPKPPQLNNLSVKHHLFTDKYGFLYNISVKPHHFTDKISSVVLQMTASKTSRGNFREMASSGY